MLDMRFRLIDVATGAGISSAYQLEKKSNRRLSLSTCNRLWAAAKENDLRRIDVNTLQALCDIFDVDTNVILERDKKPRR